MTNKNRYLTSAINPWPMKNRLDINSKYMTNKTYIWIKNKIQQNQNMIKTVNPRQTLTRYLNQKWIHNQHKQIYLPSSDINSKFMNNKNRYPTHTVIKHIQNMSDTNGKSLTKIKQISDRTSKSMTNRRAWLPDFWLN